MAVLESLGVEVTVVLGRARMPLHRLLRLNRGAVIALEATEDDRVEILANDHPIARGRIAVTGEAIAVEVVELIRRPQSVRTPGSAIGTAAMPLHEPA